MEQAKIEQIKDIEFELTWQTRETIISSLSQHTKLLSGLLMKAVVKERMLKANSDLMTALMHLPLKADGRLRRSVSPGCTPEANKALEVSWDVRSRIVDTLMANYSVARLEGDSVTDECKSKLINQNVDLICELRRTLADSSDSSASNEDHHDDSVAEASESKTTKEEVANEEKPELSDPDQDTTPVEQPAFSQTTSSSVDEEVAILRRELEALETKLTENVEELGQCSAIINLEKEVQDLNNTLRAQKGLAICRSEFTFIFERSESLYVQSRRPRKGRSAQNRCGQDGSLRCVAVSPDGSLCASAGKDAKVRLLDLDCNCKLLHTLDPEEGPIDALCFSPNRYWLCLAVGSMIKIFDIENQTYVYQLELVTEPDEVAPRCVSLNWSADGCRLFSGHTDYEIRVWRLD